jgi:hypothetical protein
VGLGAALALALACAGPAAAGGVPGASYSGALPNGATIELTVSADGTRLVRYRLANVPGDTCLFLAQGEPPEWETPIAGDAFEYRLYDAILFRGSFGAANTASGTFRLLNHAVQGVKPACDTGTVSWTATTTAEAPGSPAPAGGGPAAAVSPGAAVTSPRARYRSSLGLRRRSSRQLSGRVSSPNRACLAGRRIALRRGSVTLATTTSRADGTFVFRRTRATRGHGLRARVAELTRPATVCAAAQSSLLRG